jgi:hypothetical protein
VELYDINVTSYKFCLRHIVCDKNYVNFDVIIILSEKYNITGIYKSAIHVLK